MPFCKRTILPRDVCKPLHGDARPREELYVHLGDVCGFTLCSVLRQLADVSRHGVGILEELQGELASVVHRSAALENRALRLQRHVTVMVSKPPPRATSGLDSESHHHHHHHHHHGDSVHGNGGGGGGGGGANANRGAHFRSPWQQSVNVFGSWNRPECVEELHQQAQLNLQSLLQDFEEQLYDSKLTGQTFRHPPSSQSSDETTTSLSRSPVSVNNKRPDFIFLPASKQLYEDETSSSVFGLRSVANASPSPAPSPCGSDRPPLVWSSNNNSSSSTATSAAPPPVAEKPRWVHGRRTPAQFIPLDITGETGVVGGGGGGGAKFHGVDLLQHSPCPSPGDLPHQPRSLEPVTDTPHQGVPLRKTHSDLEAILNPDNTPDRRSKELLHPVAMDHSGLLCSTSPSSSWNGPKGSTFSPGAWNEPYNSNNYHSSTSKGPAVPPKQHTIVGGTIQSVHSDHRPPIGKRSETEGGEASRGRQRSARSIAAANAFKFRERSLSTPTDSDSFGFDGRLPTGNGMSDQRHNNYLGMGENYALMYPSGSSEDSASTADTISMAASDYSTESRLRLRSRSISLKKSKRKPPPPVRSVSLMKNLGEAEGRIHHERGLYRDGRPKSLHIPREQYTDFQPDFLLPSSGKMSGGDGAEGRRVDRPPSLEIQAPDNEGETDFPNHWQLGEWKNNNDPYRSLSGSSTATGTTVIECMKVRGSSESLLDSPSTSRATSPSLLSAEPENKASSPFRPHGLMSPSSGYSSQSEAPTPTVPHNHGTGHGTGMLTGCKLRPKIPERKSSLPSPKDPAARSRLSFEMPGNAHLELSSIKPKQKASRRHSDTSTAEKPGKISPSSSQALPVVTQNELKTIRLRSVSRGDLEDCPDGASDTIEEEMGRDIGENPSPPPTLPKPRPPVAIKPPLPKRPMNLQLKPPSPSSTSLSTDSPPGSPVDRPVPLGNIYKVMKKPKPKKPPPQVPDVNSNTIQNASYESQFIPHAHSLFDLPPLPDPQPLLEDPALEPEFDPDLEVRPGDGGSLPSPCSHQEAPELQNKSKTLPTRMTAPCLSELADKKKPKVPPPVPKKPNVLLFPSSGHSSSNGGSERPTSLAESPVCARSPVGTFLLEDLSSSPNIPECLLEEREEEEEQNYRLEAETDSSKDSSLQSSLQDSSLTELENKMAAAEFGADDSALGEKTVLHIAEEADDDVLTSTASTHTTEDLFTIIHRSKRKVLGRKEPTDSFGSRQNLSSSPVKHNAGGSDLRSYTLGGAPRSSSSRNENFMALLQKKGSKSSGGGTRVSAMELLKSTNPLARRVTEFSGAPSDEAESGNGTNQ